MSKDERETHWVTQVEKARGLVDESIGLMSEIVGPPIPHETVSGKESSCDADKLSDLLDELVLAADDLRGMVGNLRARF